MVAAAGVAWRTEGGWGAAAAATLAASFAWASVSKVTGWSRWRATLAAHALPPGPERVAGWAVPAVESLVPILAFLGRPRAAGAIAVTSIVVFSAALVRLALRDGLRVSCGCFGRGSIDVRLALARNAAIAVAAALAWWSAPSDPVLRVPEVGESLPALLVAGALTVAAVTAWRAAVWLGRGSA
jgi:hypothetical protein